MNGQHRVSVKRQAELTHVEWMRQSRIRAILQANRARALGSRSRNRSGRRQTSAYTDEPIAEPAWTSYERLEEINRNMSFSPLNDTDSTRLEEEAKTAFADTVLDKKVCLITDTWVFPNQATLLPIEELPFSAMRVVLTGEPWVTSPVAQYYDCSDLDERCRGMLLSRRAFQRDVNNALRVWILTTALQDLRAIATRVTRAPNTSAEWKPPRFAIADCFVAGTYPAIDRLTIIERQAIGLTQVRGVVKVVYGGPGNVLNSHLLCWDNRDATIAGCIPTVVGRDNFHLILAGPLTTAQELLLAKRHECNVDRVQQAHQLLRRINPLYADVVTNTAFKTQLGEGDSLSTRLGDDDDAAQLIVQARGRQTTVARMNDEAQGELRECTVVETQTALLETVIDRTEHDRLTTAYANVTPTSGTFVVHRSSSLLDNNDPRYIELLFPHLLTFGIGGFWKDRRNRYAKRDIVLHYLNLSTSRFAEDPIFKLAMFDYLSMVRVKTGVFLRVGQDPELATTVLQISPSQLKTVMTNRSRQRAAWKKGQMFVPMEESNLAARVLKSVNASTGKMWGSNEERESMTRKVDAMTIKFGAPSVFWTLTPNPDLSITCAFWTGHQLPGGRPDALNECSELNMPCNSEMARLVMTNTVVQANYYRLCCYILIDILFGWDTSVQKPKLRRGIFGTVEALLYALEQQGRLFIHHHGVAWVAGLPKTKSDWDSILASPDLRARFERYCASLFASELPVYSDIYDLICPRTDCNGPLVPLPIHKKFKHVLKPSVEAPLVAKCDICSTAFSEKDIVSALIDTKWNTLDTEHKAASSSSAVEAIRHRLGGLSTDKTTSDVQLSRLLLKDQVHAYAHARSCIKGRTGTKCRYNFFKKIVSTTGLNDEDEMEYLRRIGNQWLNTYIPIWRHIFHFNMDARALWTGHGLQATRYALKYAVKRQTVLDNVAVVEMAFKKRIDRETNIDKTDYSRGVGRLMSLAYANSGVMEIGGPLATAILMEGEAVTFSCTFERLVLVEGLNILSKAQVQATVVRRDDQLYTETSILKYMQRPSCLEHYNWYDFCSWFHKQGPTSRGSSRPCKFTSTSAADLRSHLKLHGYSYSEYPRVPDIIGPRLPDSTRLGNEDYEDQSELYYRMAALLYHPFRNVDMILGGSNSAKSFYDTWRPLNDRKTARALELHQQYYICLDMAHQYREKQRADGEDSSDDDEVCLDEDVLQHGTANFSRESHNYTTIPPELYCPDSDINMDVQDNTAFRSYEPDSALQHLLQHCLETSTLPPDYTSNFAANATAITRAQVADFKPRVHIAANSNYPDATGSFTTLGTTSVVVVPFEQATRELRFAEDLPVLPEIRTNASIGEISRHFSLNRQQHMAFTLIAMPLLAKITGATTTQERSDLFSVSPIIVTGAGGTGKSQIVAAVRALAVAWNRPQSVMVVASTGIAAASLNGCTMHSSVGLGINTTRLPKHIESPTDDLLRRWAPVLCVIADEVSMIDLGFFGIWEESLRHAKENLDERYGGLIAVLMFDHCQLRTVKGAPMYKTSCGDKPFTQMQDRGRVLYQSITKVVYLSENMRFLQDVEWGQWLASARLGNWTEQLRSYITSLPELSTHLQDTDGLIQTISSDNATRAMVNETAINLAVKSIGDERKVYVVRARLSRRISPIELAFIRTLPDNKTANIPIFLHIYIGMPVRVKANQCVPKGLVNGACGTVHHVDWPHTTEFTLQRNGTWLASTSPDNIYINLANSPTPERFPLLPPDWPSSVMPIYQITSAVTMQGPPLSIRGFPLVPAFGTTVHGVQGETRHAVAITNLRVKHVDPHALYVALSRLRTRNGLHWIGNRPSSDDFDYFHPGTEVLMEDNRLKHLSNTTLCKFEQVVNV